MLHQIKIIIFSLLVSALISNTGEAKTFSNAYISFNMPDTWNCTLEQTEWVCRSTRAEENKEAIIILTAKEVGPTDSFSNYRQHLSNPLQAHARLGQSTMSQIIYTPKELKISNQDWLDGLHLGSEVPNYYTRYLATIKDNKISILVTFSAHKAFYPKYSQLFFDAINSLKVNATSDILNKMNAGPIRGAGDDMFGSRDGLMLDGDSPMPVPESGKKNNLYIGLALILAAIGLYLIYRARKR
jgi:hypothetical protein